MSLPIARIIGHREWSPGRKSDPVFDMDWARAGVAGIRPHPAAAPAADTLPEDLMRPIALTYGTQDRDDARLLDPDPDGLDFRGSCTVEAGDFSSAIEAAWVRWAAHYGWARWRIVFWDATRPIGEVPDTDARDYFAVPPQCRSFTVEGSREHPGVTLDAALVLRAKP